MRWPVTIGRWIIPVSLAAVMVGQIFFAAIQFHLGIEHPAWLFWGLLAAGIVTILLRGISPAKLTPLDMAMLAFVAILVVSFLSRGLSNSLKAYYYIVAFILLPFLAGRLLDTTGITKFLKAAIVIAATAIPLVGIGLLNLPESELHSDRISTLFAAYDPSGLGGGVSTIPFVGTAFGLLLVLTTAYGATLRLVRWDRRLTFTVALMCIAVWFLMFVGTRASLLAASVVSIALFVFAFGHPIPRRLGLILILLSAIAVSWLTLPSERMIFLGQVATIKKEAEKVTIIQREPEKVAIIQREPDSICGIYGNSPATRIHYYAIAVKLFLDAPLLGIGAGNYGYQYCGSSEDFVSPHSSLLQVLAELGLLGGASYLLLVGMTLLGLISILKHGSEKQRGMAWMLAAIWLFFFLLDQMSGNYFTSFQFFAATGLVSGLVAASGIPITIFKNLSTAIDAIESKIFRTHA